MLKEVYGPELVLEPYVMSVDAFQQYEQSGKTQQLCSIAPYVGGGIPSRLSVE